MVLLLATLGGCSSAPDYSRWTVEELYPDGCDPVSSLCGYPFPSDVWTVPDATTETGKHVHFHSSHARPLIAGDLSPDLAIFEHNDGFSPGAEMLVVLPGATLTGLPPVTNIAQSVEADSPTVILDTLTGQRVPHFAELDAQDDLSEPGLLILRPVVRLADARRYIVAIRGVVDASGALVAPSQGFRALRDGKSSPFPSIRARREAYEAMFATLATAGIARDDLQIAWDFTTASDANNVGRMLHIRDTALAMLNGQPVTYQITSVTDDVDANIARRIAGTVHVPCFLDDPGAGGRFVLDDHGMPTSQGWADYPFTLQIPTSVAAGAPGRVLQFGHGLFGSREDADESAVRSFANEHGYVVLALDWLGMSNQDYGTIGKVVLAADLPAFATVPDRGQQAMLNQLLALDAVLDAMASDAQTFVGDQPTIATNDPVFYGISLGGIYGSVYLTLSPRIQRGVLLVPGQPFDLLLPRNRSAFPAFRALLTFALADMQSIPMLLGMIQMLWDRAEPTGYTTHTTSNPLPGAIAHDVLMIDAIGDQTVSTLGAHIMARAMGLSNVQPVARDIYGIPNVTGPFTGSGLIEMNYGPAESTTNVPSTAPGDPHGKPIAQSSVVARDMAAGFLADGTVENLCSGVCDPF